MNRIVCALSFLVILGCTAKGAIGDTSYGKDSLGDSGGECSNASASGFRSFTHNGVTREYILYAPSGYDASSGDALPLVINFHGNGGCASLYSLDGADGSADMRDEADRHNFILAYPQGVVREKGAAEWDPGDTGTENISENDVFFTDQLIADINSTHPVDASRVYAVGYSNGGMMAYGLACQGDTVAAAGIMSGIMLPGSCSGDHYTSIIHFHGTSDGALPYDGSTEYQSVADTIAFWVNHNAIPSSSLNTTELDGGQVTQDTYTGGAENTSVVLYTVQGGGHVWFSDDIGGTSPNEIIWSFLSQYDLNGLASGR